MYEAWVVLRKELRQQVRDRRALVLLFVPALLAPAVCMLLLLSQASGPDVNEKQMSVWSTDRSLDSSEVLQYIDDSLDLPNSGEKNQRQWNVRWSDTPWDDLVRGKSDLALIQQDDGSWKIVPSPMSLDSAELTAEAVVALKDPIPERDGFANPRIPRSSEITNSIISVADFFGEPSANRGIASYLLPVLLLSLFTLAGSAVAIECVAAEKECGTFESLRVSGAPGVSILFGKLFAVVFTSAASGGLALLFLVGVGSVRPRGAWNLGLDYVLNAGLSVWNGLVLGLLTTSALLLCSAMLLFVSGLAKTIKEAQYWVSLVSFIPVSLGGASIIASGDQLARALEVIPFSNVAIGMSEVISGTYDIWSLAECLTINFVLSVTLVCLAVRMLFGVVERN
ncbi:ABC transporter permease [Rhodococcus fascians]|nr:ABC transporter permease [Rhodococcus fascians]MBY4397254.1 ABC transporter permease [Rhodococcus fascians]MBY4406074.1 ABC transporter permease [Rhodococcus fascians]MBY4422005.1 ABC transporter permease [Rhodococcus fascians]MBY4461500.1 ABC transporter permease [Rhodococcus fascians]